MISFANNNIAYLPPVSTSYSANASLVTEDYCASDVTLSDLKFGETEYKFFKTFLYWDYMISQKDGFVSLVI
jgi:hypothetical protein